MKLLLDTHIFLWVLDNSPGLSQTHRNLIADPNNEKFVRYFSLMEIAIKLKLGKLPDVQPDIELISEHLVRDGFQLLPVEVSHIQMYQDLPLFNDHRDPFDRFLIATAISENCSILTVDEKYKLYQNMANVVMG
jgi:PIN domain nuclease of toxin-antitoxin system